MIGLSPLKTEQLFLSASSNVEMRRIDVTLTMHSGGRHAVELQPVTSVGRESFSKLQEQRARETTVRSMTFGLEYPANMRDECRDASDSKRSSIRPVRHHAWRPA